MWEEALSGVNGERRDAAAGCDLLGLRARAYSPNLMRFCSPDAKSPFSEGGVNAYGYCGGDPVNFSDPDGHSRVKSVPRKVVRDQTDRTRFWQPWKDERLHSNSRNITETVNNPAPSTSSAAAYVVSGEPTSQFVPGVWDDAKSQLDRYWSRGRGSIYKPNRYSDRDYISVLSIKLSKQRKQPTPYAGVKDYVRREIGTIDVKGDAGTLNRMAASAIKYNEKVRSGLE